MIRLVPKMQRRLLLLLVLAVPAVLGAAEPRKPNGPIFGSPTPIPGALQGLVYRLPKDTGHIPNFATYKPVGAVYTTRLDYPLQNYGDEWFGIEYTGRFYITVPGDYYFQLTVDDGASIIIDGKTIVHVDGVHPVRVEEGHIRLKTGWHEIRVPYFQGPVPYIALVVEVEPPKGKRRIFDITEFQPRPEQAPEEHRPTLQRK